MLIFGSDLPGFLALNRPGWPNWAVAECPSISAAVQTGTILCCDAPHSLHCHCSYLLADVFLNDMVRSAFLERLP
jgi:hypothetical protein